MVGLTNADNVLARERSRLIKGPVQETLDPFLEATPGLRISILNLGMDLYEPTLHALERLWDLVVPGGIVRLRGTDVVYLPGAAKACPAG